MKNPSVGRKVTVTYRTKQGGEEQITGTVLDDRYPASNLSLQPTDLPGPWRIPHKFIESVRVWPSTTTVEKDWSRATLDDAFEVLPLAELVERYQSWDREVRNRTTGSEGHTRAVEMKHRYYTVIKRRVDSGKIF